METTKEGDVGGGDEGQITKEPQRIVREKDPKKVAAGKKLVEYNRKAKKALLEKEAAEKKAAEKNANKEEEEGSEGTWVPELNFTSVLTMIGLGLTAADLYLKWRRSNPPASPGPNPSETSSTPTPADNTPMPSPSPPVPSAPTKTKVRIGMEGP